MRSEYGAGRPSRRRRPRVGTVFALIAVVLWITSLLLPALGARGGPTLSGFDVLRQGVSAWRYGVLAWFGNPALLVAVVALVRQWPRVATGAAALGLVLAASSFWTGDIAALGGRTVPELSFAPGFYWWMAAHSAALIGGIYAWVERPGGS